MHYVNTKTSQDLWYYKSAIGVFLVFPLEFISSTILLLCFGLNNKHVAAILVYQAGRILPQATVLLPLPINQIGLSGNASYLHAGL
jgi:hypothetical protein